VGRREFPSSPHQASPDSGTPTPRRSPPSGRTSRLDTNISFFLLPVCAVAVLLPDSEGVADTPSALRTKVMSLGSADEIISPETREALLLTSGAEDDQGWATLAPFAHPTSFSYQGSLHRPPPFCFYMHYTTNSEFGNKNSFCGQE